MPILAWDGRYLVASMFSNTRGNYSGRKCKKCDADMSDAYRYTNKMCTIKKDVWYDNEKKIIAVAWDGPVEYATSFISKLTDGNTFSELGAIFKHGKPLLKNDIHELILILVLEDRTSVIVFIKSEGLVVYPHKNPPCVVGKELSTLSGIQKASGVVFESAGACVKAGMLANHPSDRRLMYYDFDNLTEDPVIKIIPKLSNDVEKRWNFIFEPLEDLRSL